MGLDTCMLIVTHDGIPMRWWLMGDNDITRHELDRLSGFIGMSDLMKGIISNRLGVMIYEVDGTVIASIRDNHELDLSFHVINRISGQFGEFLDHDGAEEAFAKDPCSGMPPSKVRPGYRLFMLFEG